MTGYNHYSNCTCGWCVGGWRNHSPSPPPPRPARWTIRWTYESFTIPNAACPVCGARVFFYQSPYGGRVFFDDLGPPWPKHGCTDNIPQPVSRTPKRQSDGSAPEHSPAWKIDDWIPIAVDRVYLEDEWHVLKCRRLADDSFLRLLSTEPINDIIRAPAFLSPVTEAGFATVSYLAADASPREAAVYDYGAHCLSSPEDAYRARRADLSGSTERNEASNPLDGSYPFSVG